MARGILCKKLEILHKRIPRVLIFTAVTRSQTNSQSSEDINAQNDYLILQHSTVEPEKDERGGKLLGLREPRIISLVLDASICMSLLAVQGSSKVKYVGMLQRETVSGINSESVVSVHRQL